MFNGIWFSIVIIKLFIIQDEISWQKINLDAIKANKEEADRFYGKNTESSIHYTLNQLKNESKVMVVILGLISIYFLIDYTIKKYKKLIDKNRTILNTIIQIIEDCLLSVTFLMISMFWLNSTDKMTKFNCCLLVAINILPLISSPTAGFIILTTCFIIYELMLKYYFNASFIRKFTKQSVEQGFSRFNTQITDEIKSKFAERNLNNVYFSDSINSEINLLSDSNVLGNKSDIFLNYIKSFLKNTKVFFTVEKYFGETLIFINSSKICKANEEGNPVLIHFLKKLNLELCLYDAGFFNCDFIGNVATIITVTIFNLGVSFYNKETTFYHFIMTNLILYVTNFYSIIPGVMKRKTFTKVCKEIIASSSNSLDNFTVLDKLYVPIYRFFTLYKFFTDKMELNEKNSIIT
ncbi:hypothetical protein NUSPORA_02674 [Nucleospora cyclopteri]